MLVEIKKHDIVTVALSSGQEVIGKFVEEADDTITMERPLTIAFGPEGAAFQPFTMTGDSDGKVTLNKKLVIATMPAREETGKNYRQATSGIVV